MQLKSESQIIKDLTKKFLEKEENVYYLDRLFMANTVVRWVFRHANNQEEILQYLIQIDKYLNREINLSWKNGEIKVERKKEAKHENVR